MLIIAIMKGATHEPAATSSTTSFPLGWAAPTNPGVKAKGSDRVLRIAGSEFRHEPYSNLGKRDYSTGRTNGDKIDRDLVAGLTAREKPAGESVLPKLVR